MDESDIRKMPQSVADIAVTNKKEFTPRSVTLNIQLSTNQLLRGHKIKQNG